MHHESEQASTRHHARRRRHGFDWDPKYAHRTINGGIGHNLPQEAPQVFAEAVVDVDGFAS
jgi:hypothetical protein